MSKVNVAAVLSLLALLAVPASPQGTSSLQGTVTDPSGAVVPGAKIEITNTDTQAVRSTESNAVGAYVFPQVSPGAYNLTATADGLVAVGIPSIQLLVNQPVTVDVEFQDVGSLTEIVSVEAETEQINTVDASLGNAVGTRPILQLPFEARNVVALLSVQPGVAFTRDTEERYTTDTRNGAVNGGKSDQANITLDGVDVNDQQNGFAFDSVLRVTLDSVQEFRTTTLNAGADQGRSSGAQVALVTKSGTNSFHGSAYWYHRNTATTANSFFNNAVPASEDNPEGGIPRPKLIRNIFGGSFGGPVKKNRLFFYFNYERRTDRSAESVVRTVPTASLRQGIVKYLDNDGAVVSLSPQDMANVIDPLGIGPNENMLATLNRFPLPNDETRGDLLNTAGYRFVSPIKTNLNTYITRWDYYIDSASRHQLFFRGNYQDDLNTTAVQFPGFGPNRSILENSKGLAIGLGSTLSPISFNSFRYGLTRQAVDRAGANTISQVEFRNIDNLFDPAARSLIRIVPVHTFRDDLSIIKGKHTLKLGGVVRVIRNQRTSYSNSYNRAVINSSWLDGSGAELSAPIADSLSSRSEVAYLDAAAVVLGLVPQADGNYNYDLQGNVLPTGAPVFRNFAEEQYEFYLQDTWRITRGLTLTAGLRYNLSPPVREQNGYEVSTSISLGEWFNTRGALMQQGRSQAEAGDIEFILRDDPGARPVYPYHKKKFAPRIALAYSPQVSDGLLGKLIGGPGKTSIRAGFGMFHDNFGQGLMRLADTGAIGLSTNLTNPSFSLGVADSPRYTAIDEIPQSILPAAPPGGFPQRAPDAFAITNSIDDTIKPPYSMALNFSIGRELPNDFFLEASYVGRLSRRSLIQRDLAMPADITDPKSGMTYFEAANVLVDWMEGGVPVDQAPVLPYWENLFPEAAFDGLTATQNIYDLYSAVAPDYTYGLFLLDRVQLFGTGALGDHAFYNEQFAALSAWSSVGGGNYHAGQLTLRKRFSSGFQFDLNYTLSKSMDLSSTAERVGSFDGFLINSWSPHQLRATSDYDMRHQVNANWVIELPFGSGRRWGSDWNRALDAVLGGWQLSGLWRMTSGMNSSVFNGRQWPTNWQITGYATQTGPNPVQGAFKSAPGVIEGEPGGASLFADPASAAEAWVPTRPGESGQRNGVRGHGYFTLDLGVSKIFRMPWEGHAVQFRWEVFNVTNSVRFDPYSASLTLSDLGSFGRYQDLLTNPRVMQFALRYDF